MPIALILQLFAVAQAAAEGAPAAIEAVKRVRALIAGKGEKVTVDELANALQGAQSAHDGLDAALRSDPNVKATPFGLAATPHSMAAPADVRPEADPAAGKPSAAGVPPENRSPVAQQNVASEGGNAFQGVRDSNSLAGVPSDTPAAKSMPQSEIDKLLGKK